MPTTTTNYSFTLPEVGGDTDQWGTQLNANWTLADTTLKTIADSVGDDVTLTGNDYLTISGQAITVGSVDLTTDVTGTLPVGSGGTGLTSLGTANQVLAVNAGGSALEFQNAGSGTVTSVAVTGSDGIEVDSGSPITASGTIALGINSTTLSTHLGLGSLATQSSVTESQISDLGSYITASSTDTLTNKSGNISQWTNDSGYLTAETNNLSTVSGTLGTANGGTGLTAIGTANQVLAVNAGATALEFQTISITESQISDLQSYLTAESNDLSSAVTWANVPNANITQGSVTQHQAALSITESQISDFGSYQASDAGLTSIAGLTTAADKMLYTTAADTYAVATLTSAGRALLDDADASAQRTTLGLGSLATQDANSVTLTGGSLTGIEIDLKSSGTTIYKSDGTTAVLSESAGTVTLTADEANVGSNALVVDSSGDVGIGTSSPIAVGSRTTANIKGSAGAALRLSDDTSNLYLDYTDSTGGRLFVNAAESMTFGTNSIERMRIDSSGNVGIGTSPSDILHVLTPTFGGITIECTGATADPVLKLLGDSGNDWRIQQDASEGDSLQFRYNNSSKVKIDSSGNVLVGYTSSNGSYKLQVNSQIFATSSTIATSDGRYKENIQQLDGGLAIVQALNPVQFDWKEHPVHQFDREQPTVGFIAQEVQEALADKAYKNSIIKSNTTVITPEELDEHGNVITAEVTEEFLGIAEGNLIAILTKAIQEQQSQIDALTTRIEALETA